MSNVLHTETFFSATALDPYRIVTLNGDGKIAYADDFTSNPLGVTDELGCKAAGDVVDVDMLGVVLVRVAEPVSALDAIAPDSNGKGVVARGLSMSTLGIAVESAAAAEEVIRVLRVGTAGGNEALLVRPYTAEGAVTKGHILKVGSADDDVAHATAGSDTPIGVALNNAADDGKVYVAHGGIVQAISSAAIARGSRVRAAAGGKGAATSTASDGVAGIALQAAATDTSFALLVCPSSV